MITMRKGAMTMEMLVILVILAVLALVLLQGIFTGGTSWLSGIGQYSNIAAKKACPLQGDLIGGDYKDCDGDGYPDVCDRCIDGGDPTDIDNDGMPDICEQPWEVDAGRARIVCKFKQVGASRDNYYCSAGPPIGHGYYGMTYEEIYCRTQGSLQYDLTSEGCPTGEMQFERLTFEIVKPTQEIQCP